MNTQTKRPKAWTAHFERTGELHPDELAAIKAECEREWKRTERNAAQRARRHLRKLKREDERRDREAREKTRREIEAERQHEAALRAAEPAIVAHDAAMVGIREVELEELAWATANAHQLMRWAARLAAHHVLGHDAGDEHTCMWCAARRLRERRDAHMAVIIDSGDDRRAAEARVHRAMGREDLARIYEDPA